MSNVRNIFFGLMILTATLLPTPALAHSGHTNWGAWRFDWEVKDNAGIALRNVYYNNELVIYKASMPVIRVRYHSCPGSSCGPYADQLNWGNLVEISNCGNHKVCQRAFTSGGHQWLELGVLSKIGKYRIYHVWYLRDDGVISPHLFSRGLHHVANHDHHVYWRFDFDINGAASDQVFVFDNTRPNQGWGAGWHKYTGEVNDLKNFGTQRKWFVRDDPSAHGIWVFPGQADGTTDFFSTKDVAGRRYNSAEDTSWPFGAWGHLGYANSEDIQEKDIVFWYVAHMFHAAAEGPDLWHSAGPTLVVAR